MPFLKKNYTYEDFLIDKSDITNTFIPNLICT